MHVHPSISSTITATPPITIKMMCQSSSMEGEVVAMTVGVAERATVLLVGDDIVNMTVGVSERSTVLLAGGGILSLTVGVAERSTVEVGVAEGVACCVFCACIGERGKGGVRLCTSIVLV